MSNYHFEVTNTRRGKGPSITLMASYITGIPLHEPDEGKQYDIARDDVLFWEVFMPTDAPEKYHDLQTLCLEIENAEHRRDSRTSRIIVCSLPNEMTLDCNIQLVKQFVIPNFVRHRICVLVGIHEGKNMECPKRDNPHVHMLISTRTIDSNGFNTIKDRIHNKREYICLWRENWAKVINRAYEREGLDIHVDHRSFRDQGIVREPLRHLSRTDYEREARGERTLSGDLNREIRQRNEGIPSRSNTERSRNHELELER